MMKIIKLLNLKVNELMNYCPKLSDLKRLISFQNRKLFKTVMC